MADSSVLVTCACGAKLRTPSGIDVRVRCPACGRVSVASAGASGGGAYDVDVPVKGAKNLSAEELASGVAVLCPVCQTAVKPGDAAVRCDACSVPHHRECWTEVGGCGAYGCRNAPTTATKEAASTPASGWGDTKLCPVCGETIKSVALKCRYCASEFDTVDPLTPDEYATRMTDGVRLKTVKQGAIGLFVVAIVVFFIAPLTFVASLVWTLWRHRDLQACGTTYLVLAWLSVGLSLIYSLVLAGAMLLG